MVTPQVIEQVRRELAAIEATEDVRILYAVESGSRAWGFASIDSDYDVRLIYAHRPEWYLSIDLEHRRDVIERQCPGDVDLAGWDIRKALRLFARSNPPLLEWLDSPIVYRDDEVFAPELRLLLPAFYSPAACSHHYVRMARRNVDAYLRGDRVRHKKYFYVLRPLLAAMWIEQGRGPVPMLFASLRKTVQDRPGLVAAIDELLSRKMRGGEMGEGPRIPDVHDFVATELPRLEDAMSRREKDTSGFEPLHELYRRTLDRVW